MRTSAFMMSVPSSSRLAVFSIAVYSFPISRTASSGVRNVQHRGQLANLLPHRLHILTRGPDVADGIADDETAVQDVARKKRQAGIVETIDQPPVVVVAAAIAEANQRQRRRRDQLEAADR